MTWQVISRPEAETEVIEIAAWYDSRSEGVGDRFVEEFLAVLNELTINPLLYCRRHPSKNILFDQIRNHPTGIIKLARVNGARLPDRPPTINSTCGNTDF